MLVAEHAAEKSPSTLLMFRDYYLFEQSGALSVRWKLGRILFKTILAEAVQSANRNMCNGSKYNGRKYFSPFLRARNVG